MVLATQTANDPNWVALIIALLFLSVMSLLVGLGMQKLGDCINNDFIGEVTETIGSFIAFLALFFVVLVIFIVLAALTEQIYLLIT